MVLVTGESSGIGKAATLALSDAGSRVIGTSRNAARGTLGNGVTFPDLDVTSDESVTNVVQQVIARLGRLDVLVKTPTSAATAPPGISVAAAHNVFGLMRMTKAVLPQPHQHPIRRQHGAGRHPAAGLGPATAHLRPCHGRDDEGPVTIPPSSPR